MIAGIDLGTTNSAIAVWHEGEAKLVPNALGDALTPSAVSIGDDGAVLVGLAARDRRATHPRVTATTFKRLMGTQQKVRLGKTEFTPEDLSALVIRSLVDDVEAASGQVVTGVVITVPAYFNDRQRKATRRAGEIAGVKVERLINEPTAAALAFGVADRDDREPFLVFDLGGGTFDVSIVEMFDDIVEVRATAGDNRLGGEDFNDALIAAAKGELDRDGVLAKGDPARLGPLLHEAAERARRALTDGDSATMTVTWEGRTFEATVTADAFEAQAAGLIARLRDPVLRSLRDSGIRSEDLSEIVLVGGSTRMPIVRRAITRMFGRFPNTLVHPDHAVALGAAVQAGLLSRDVALKEVRLTDVCPFTLGVETSREDARGHRQTGLFAPIIDRNTPLPVSRVETFCTVFDNQRMIDFAIYQGEAREVVQNVKLGNLKVPVPPKKGGHVECECRFTYDASGFLDVDVRVVETGETYNLAIVDEHESVPDAEIAAKRAALARLKMHPRDDSANQAVLARAARCYEGFTGDRRDQIGRLVLDFEAMLATQDERQIAPAREGLIAALDEIEGMRYL